MTEKKSRREITSEAMKRYWAKKKLSKPLVPENHRTKRVEELQDEYNACEDKERRAELMKEINALLFGSEAEHDQ